MIQMEYLQFVENSRNVNGKERKMSDLLEKVEEELKMLEEIIEKAEKSLKTAPEGSLRISKCRETTQYYRRTNEKDKNGQYIRRKNRSLAYGLAQKEYDKELLQVAKGQKEKLCRFLKEYMPDKMENVYRHLSTEHQKLIMPYILPEEQYVKEWESRVYRGKEFEEDAPEIYTEKGERVRSKSEKILADKFKLMGIPYLYECPLRLSGYGIVYPDFTLLNKRTRKEYYMEHFGRMDDEKYAEKVVQKIETYQKNGIYPGEKLLMTFETSKKTLNMIMVEQMLIKYLV